MGGAILDRDEPSKVLYRCENYLLTPEMPYEVSGFVPNVVFPCATVQDADTGRIAIYYVGSSSAVSEFLKCPWSTQGCGHRTYCHLLRRGRHLRRAGVRVCGRDCTVHQGQQRPESRRRRGI